MHGFPVGFTYNGHPTACAVALGNLDIIEREGLLDRCSQIGGTCWPGSSRSPICR